MNRFVLCVSVASLFSVQAMAIGYNLDCVVNERTIPQSCFFYDGRACARKIQISTSSTTASVTITLGPKEIGHEVLFTPIKFELKNTGRDSREIYGTSTEANLDLTTQNGGLWAGSLSFETIPLLVDCSVRSIQERLF